MRKETTILKVGTRLDCLDYNSLLFYDICLHGYREIFLCFITSSILISRSNSIKFFFLVFVIYLQVYNKFSQVNEKVACLEHLGEEYVL